MKRTNERVLYLITHRVRLLEFCDCIKRNGCLLVAVSRSRVFFLIGIFKRKKNIYINYTIFHTLVSFEITIRSCGLLYYISHINNVHYYNKANVKHNGILVTLYCCRDRSHKVLYIK